MYCVWHASYSKLGSIATYLGWRGLFYMCGVLAVVLVILIFFFLPETLPPTVKPRSFNPTRPLSLLLHPAVGVSVRNDSFSFFPIKLSCHLRYMSFSLTTYHDTQACTSGLTLATIYVAFFILPVRACYCVWTIQLTSKLILNSTTKSIPLALSMISMDVYRCTNNDSKYSSRTTTSARQKQGWLSCRWVCPPWSVLR